MNTFENELFTTVDSILALLGHKPTYNRDADQSQPSTHIHTTDINQSKPNIKSGGVSKPKGPRLIKTSSELQRVIENL